MMMMTMTMKNRMICDMSHENEIQQRMTSGDCDPWEDEEGREACKVFQEFSFNCVFSFVCSNQKKARNPRNGSGNEIDSIH